MDGKLPNQDLLDPGSKQDELQELYCAFFAVRVSGISECRSVSAKQQYVRSEFSNAAVDRVVFEHPLSPHPLQK